MSLPKMKNNLHPELRSKTCIHAPVAYRGSIPCTGPLKCSMCGTLFENWNELAQARHEALKEISKQNDKEV